MNKYMKKWWLETPIIVEGNLKIFKGWINTTSDSEEAFPGILHGRFWAEKTEAGLRGRFILDGQTEDEAVEKNQFVVLAGIYNPDRLFQGAPQSTAEAELLLGWLAPIDCCFDRFERRLEECIVPGKTYVMVL